MATNRKNYSSDELTRFKELVKKYAGIIEDKRTDSKSLGEKNLAWTRLTKEFNSVSKVYRSEESLKNKWKNIKKGIRNGVANEKKYVTGTGGGSSLPASLKVAEDDDQLKALISISAEGLDNDLDEDYIDVSIITESDILRLRDGNPSEEVVDDTTVNVDDFVNLSREKTYEEMVEIANANVENVSNSPKQMKKLPTKKNSTGNAGTKSQRAYQDKLSAWAAGKAELAELQKTAFERKIQQDLDMKRAEHDMRMNFEKALYEARLKEMAEKCEFEHRRRELELKILARNA